MLRVSIDVDQTTRGLRRRLSDYLGSMARRLPASWPLASPAAVEQALARLDEHIVNVILDSASGGAGGEGASLRISTGGDPLVGSAEQLLPVLEGYRYGRPLAVMLQHLVGEDRQVWHYNRHFTARMSETLTAASLSARSLTEIGTRLIEGLLGDVKGDAWEGQGLRDRHGRHVPRELVLAELDRIMWLLERELGAEIASGPVEEIRFALRVDLISEQAEPSKLYYRPDYVDEYADNVTGVMRESLLGYARSVGTIKVRGINSGRL